MKAEIRVLTGISGHADKDGLFRWISAFKQKPQKVFVNHGDDESCTVLTNRIREELHLDADAPYSGTVFDLAKGEYVTEAVPKRIQKKTDTTGRVSTVFDRLMAAGQRLMAVIRKNEGGANKDLAKFADQIQSLCDKWER